MNFNDDSDIEILETNSDKVNPMSSSTIPDVSKKELDSSVEGSSSESLSSSVSESTTSSPKKGNSILFLILFIFILLAIFLLPYTDNLFQSFSFNHKEEPDKTNINTGSLICTLEREDDMESYHYTETYDFENREILSLQHVVSIQGNADFLNTKNLECNQLKQHVSNFSGVSVDCNLSSGEFVETQFFDFSSIEEKDISSSFVEAGGVYPNVSYLDSVSDVEHDLVLSGYECRET